MAKFLLLNFDVEEFTPKTKRKISIREREQLETSSLGLEKLLKLLDRHRITSTFFTTLKFAKQNHGIIGRLVREGHELALHGYEHTDNYKAMQKDEAYKRIKKAKEELEKRFKTKISGFRAPRFEVPDYSVLKKAGIKYDSSLHPTYVPGRYNNFRSPRCVFVKDGVVVIPVSVTPLVRLPFSWIWFRNLGLNYAKICTKPSLLDQNFINIFFHSWEFAELNGYAFGRELPAPFMRNTGEKLVGMLEKYIIFCKKIKLRPFTVRSYTEEMKLI